MFNDQYLISREDFKRKWDSNELLNRLRTPVFFNRKTHYHYMEYTFRREDHLAYIQIPLGLKDIKKGIIYSYCKKDEEFDFAFVETDDIPEWFMELVEETKIKFEQYWKIRKELNVTPLMEEF